MVTAWLLPGLILRPVLEGPLAFITLLLAFALRRRKRPVSPVGLVFLALGLIADALARSLPLAPRSGAYGQGLALVLGLWGVVHIAVDVIQSLALRDREFFSTIVADVVRAMLYLVVPVLVLRVVLDFDFGMLGVLSTVPAGGALIGWFLQSSFFKGLINQSQRPLKPGDWVKFQNLVGQVQWTGWRATRVLTAANETLQIPNGLFNQFPLTNFSITDVVADELEIRLGREHPPGAVEALLLTLLRDRSEVLQQPPPAVELSDWGENAACYRIRYWLADYSQTTEVRAHLLRSFWYALGRMAPAEPRAGALSGRQLALDLGDGAHRSDQGRALAALRRFYLLSSLGDEEIKLLIPSVRFLQFGRGETLIRQGEIGESFFLLLSGRVEVLEHDGAGRRRVNEIDASSEDNFFGEIALLTGEPRSTSIRALNDIEVLEVDRQSFTRLFRARPDAASTIATIADARITQTRERSAAALSRVVAPSRGRLLATMKRIFDFE